MDIAFLLRVVCAFGLVAILLVGLTYVVRALSRGRLIVSANRKLVTVVESTLVAQNVTLHVVKVGDRFYLLGGGSAGLTKIDDVPADLAQHWLDEQKRTLGDQRDAVVKLVSRWRAPQ
ncbi:MAG: flagellar biosynthetic protein FliO [Candidatus Velthaea sp.]|jgi:flagellar biogenesis protein FliO